MKKNIIKKTAKALCTAIFISAAAISAFSCSNSVVTESAEQTSEVNVPVLHISLNDNSRTIMPMVEISELTDIKLYGVNSSENYNSWNDYTGTKKLLCSADSIESFQEQEIYLPRNYDNTWWRFYLTAKKGNSVFSAMTSEAQKVVIGNNTLSFVLKISELESGNGILNLTVDYSKATEDSSVVTSAICELYTIDEDGSTSITASYVLETTPDTDALNVVFTNDEISSGCYKAFITLYSDTVVIGSWFEVIQISADVSTGGTISITALQKPYTFKFVTLRGNVNDAAKLTFDSTNSTILFGKELPVPSYTGYIFYNWYMDSAQTKVFDWDEISTYTPNEDGSYNVYAGWLNLANQTEGITYASDAVVYMQTADLSSASAESPYALKIIGPITTKQLTDIITAMNNITGYFSLDLRDTTGLEYLATDSDSRFTNENLVSIKLPTSVKTIENAFYGCSMLSNIIIATGNTELKSIDGVVYSADGKVIYVYPPAKAATSFTIPDGVTTISTHAFSNLTELSGVVLGDDVSVIEAKAFSGSTNTSISTASSSETWYAVSNNSFFTVTSTEIKNLSSSDKDNLACYKSVSLIIGEKLLEPLKVYPDSSKNLSDGSYTITHFGSACYYVLATESEKSYSVDWVDSYNKSGYSLPSSLSLIDCKISIYEEDGTKIIEKDDNNFTFTAKGNYTLIKVYPRSADTGDCAFRVKVYE